MTSEDELFQQGIASLEEGQYDRAISYFNKAIDMEPRSVGAYRYRGIAYAEKGQYDKAISNYNMAIRLSPNNAYTYFLRGIAYFKGGHYDVAIYNYDEAIKITPNFTEAYYNRGLAYKEKGQYNKAIADYTKTIEIKPNYTMAYKRLAWILATCADAKHRDGKQAVELAKKAAELAQEAYILDTLAAAYAESGKFEDAIITQEIAIDLARKEGKPRNIIDECIERLNSYKVHKPWREK
jgi:tetratricopeptide (TPR) repeat protein